MVKKKPAGPRWYRYVADCDDYCDFHPAVDEYDRVKNQLHAAKRIGRRWKPPKVKYTRLTGPETPRRAARRPDLAQMAGAPVFSPRAWETLGPFLGASVEALPFHCGLGDYFLINVLDMVDALELANSEAALFSTGKVMMVYEYAFRLEALQGRHIFRLPETKWIEVLVSENFKAVVEKAKLEGLIFEKLQLAGSK